TRGPPTSGECRMPCPRHRGRRGATLATPHGRCVTALTWSSASGSGSGTMWTATSPAGSGSGVNDPPTSASSPGGNERRNLDVVVRGLQGPKKESDAHLLAAAHAHRHR